MEQLSIAFRYVHGFKIVEGYTLATELNAKALADYILQKMSELDFDPNNLVSQGYDGASVMSGCNSEVQTFLKEMCPQATYVHCSAHRLNLVPVDVSEAVREADHFFAHLQILYVFFSALKCHELFLSIQKARGGRKIRLKRLSDARWACRYTSIAAVMATHGNILETLNAIINGPDRNKGVEASGILAGVKSFAFVVSLTILRRSWESLPIFLT